MVCHKALPPRAWSCPHCGQRYSGKLEKGITVAGWMLAIGGGVLFFSGWGFAGVAAVVLGGVLLLVSASL